MSNDKNNVGVKLQAPLRRFFNTKEQTDVNSEAEIPTNAKHRQFRFQQAFTCGPNNCTQRGSSSPRRVGANTNTFNNHAKPRHNSKSRKSPPVVINAKMDANLTFSRVEGECHCGSKLAPYDYLRCENCFAEDSEKFSGKDQSVILYT